MDAKKHEWKAARKYHFIMSLKGEGEDHVGFSAFPEMIGLSTLNSGLSTE